jgi:hypothetical protein
VAGDEVQSSRFVAGALEETADTQGLIAPIEHAGGWSVAGSRPVRSQDFMGYDCTLLATSDGVVRCVPSPTFYQVEFADPACNEALIAGGWEATTAVSFAEQCPPQVKVFARGEQYAGPVYRKDGAECVLDHEQPLVSRTIYHRLEGELPPDALAAMPITLY